MKRTLVAGSALALILAVWAWLLSAERRAVQSLSAEERTALYAHSLAAFEAACATPREGLEEHCGDEARFLLHFPECDERCQRLVAPHRDAGTR